MPTGRRDLEGPLDVLLPFHIAQVNRIVAAALVDITAQVHAEQALTQSEALYRNLVENSRDAVFLMQHGRVVYANDALGNILDYRTEDLIGASYFDWVATDDLAAQTGRAWPAVVLPATDPTAQDFTLGNL